MPQTVNRFTLRTLFATAIALILFTHSSAHALAIAWDGSAADMDWNNAQNWTPAQVPVAADTLTVPNNSVINLNGNQVCRTISFGSGITVSAGTPATSKLTVGDGTTGTVTVTAGTNSQFNATLELNGTVTFSAGTSIALIVNGQVTEPVGVTGRIIKTGAGRINLSSTTANTYSGGNSIGANAGTILVENNGGNLGTNANFADNVIDSAGILAFGGNVSFTNTTPFTFKSGAILRGTSGTAGVQITKQNVRIDAAATSVIFRTINVGADDFRVANIDGPAGATITAEVNPTGTAGKLTLTTPNPSYAGKWSVSHASFQINDPAALGSNTADDTVRVNATNSGKIYPFNLGVPLATNITLNGGALGVGGSDAEYSGKITVSANSIINNGDPVANRNLTVSGKMTGTANITVSSNNTTAPSGVNFVNLNPANASDYSGTLTQGQRTLIFVHGATGAFGLGTANIILNTQAAASISTLNLRSDTSIEFPNNISLGNTTLANVATLNVGSITGATGNTITVPSLTFNTVTLNLANADGYKLRVRDLAVAAGILAMGAVDASIVEDITGTTTLTKSGAGTLYLNNTTSTTAGLNVTAGTLAGNGGLNGTVTIGAAATLSPGDPAVNSGIGTLTFGKLTLTGNAAVSMQFDDDAVPASNDLIAILDAAPALNLGTSQLTIVPGPNFGLGTYLVADLPGTDVATGTMSTNPAFFPLNTSGTVSTATGGQVSFTYANGPYTDVIWTNGGGDGLWSNPANWSPSGPPASSATTILRFPNVGGTGYTSTNDLGALTINRILVTATNPVTLNNTASSLAMAGTTPSIVHDGAGTLTVDMPISDPATLTISGAVTTGSVVLAQAISGAGTLVKQGAFLLDLNGANGYTGATTISAGTVRLGNATAFGTTAGGVTAASGTVIDLNGQSIGAETLSIAGTGIANSGALTNTSAAAASTAGTVAMTASSTINTPAGDLTIAGTLSGATFSLTKIGTGLLALNGGGTHFSGVANLTQGTLSFANILALNNASTIQAAGTTATPLTLRYTGATANLTKPIALGAETNSFFVEVTNSTAVLTLSGRISGGTAGTTALTKMGPGGIAAAPTLLSNTFAGDTYIQNGQVRCHVDGGFDHLGTNGTVYVGDPAAANTADFEFGGATGSVFSLPIVVQGNGTNIIGTSNTNTTLMLPSNITLNKPVTFRGGIGAANAGAGINFAGNITGTANVTVMPGNTSAATQTLIFSGNNSFVGSVAIIGGPPSCNVNARLDKVGALGVDNAVSVALSQTLNLNNNNQVLGSLSGAGSVTPGTATLTVGSNGLSTTYAGVINGSGSLIKVGTGTLQLTGNNSYTGSTLIDGGAIQLDAPSGGLGTGALTLNGTTLDMNNRSDTVGNFSGSGQILLGSGTLGFGGTPDTTFSGTISGTGGLTKNGTGIILLTGNNSFDGPFAITAGGVTLGHVNALGSGVGGTSVATGTRLDLAGFSTADALTLNGTGIANSGALFNSSATPAATGNITLATATTIGAGSISSPAISGAFALTRTGPGTLGVGNGTVNSLTVNSGSLTGSPTVSTGALTLALRTSLFPGTVGTAGTVTASAGLTLTGTGDQVFGFDLQTPNVTGGVNDHVAVTGALDFGPSSVLHVNPLPGFTAGTYTLFSYTTQIGTLPVLGTIPGFAGTLSSGAGVVTLTVTESRKWTGLGTTSNWSDADNWSPVGIPTTGESVFFSGSTRPNIDYDVLTPLSLSRISFDTSVPFTITPVTGADVLTLTGGANAIVNGSGANTISVLLTIGASPGGIVASGGSLTIGGPLSNGNQLFTIFADVPVAITGTFSGSGGLTKTGSNVLTLSAGTFTGPVVVFNGTLKLGADNALAAVAVTVNTATLDVDSHSVTLASLSVLTTSNVLESIVTNVGSLTTTGNVIIGDNSSGTATCRLIQTLAGGSLTIGNGASDSFIVASKTTASLGVTQTANVTVANDAVIAINTLSGTTIGNVTNTAGSGFAIGTVDFSRAASVTIQANTLRIGLVTTNTSQTALGTLLLPTAAAATTSITATTDVRLGHLNVNPFTAIDSVLDLGGGTVSIVTPLMVVGGAKSGGEVRQGVGGIFNLNNGAGATTLTIGSNNVAGGTTSIVDSVVDLRNGRFVANLGNLTIGQTFGSTGGGSGSLRLSSDPLNSVSTTAIIIADRGAGTVLTNTNGLLEIGGGTFTCAGLVDFRGGVGNVLVTGGTVTFGTAGTGFALNLQGTGSAASFRVQGGSVDLTNGPIPNITTLELSGGTLKNAGLISRALTQTGGLLLRDTAGVTAIGGEYALNGVCGARVLAGTIGVDATFNITSNNNGSFIDVNGGTLELNGGTLTAGQLAFRSGAVQNVVASGPVLTGLGDALIVRSANVTFPISLTGATGGNIHYESAGNVGVTLSGNIDLGGVTRSIIVEDSATVTATELTISGLLSNGGVSKTGAGTLALSADNPYAAGTSIDAGRLLSNNTSGFGTGTGAVTVTGGIIGGSGSIGPSAGTLTIPDGAGLEPGDNGVESLEVQNLVLNPTSQLFFQLGDPAVPTTSDIVTVQGDLTLDGVLNVTGLANFGNGTYTLFTRNGATTTNNSLALGTLPLNLAYEIQINGNLVQLVVSTPGITVVAAPGGLTTSETGTQASFTVALNGPITGNVRIPISVSDSTEATVIAPAGGELLFTPANSTVAQTVTVQGLNDAIDDDDVSYSVVIGAGISTDPNYNGRDAADVSAVNTDDTDLAGVTVSTISNDTSEGGTTATFTVVLTSEPVQPVQINFSGDATEGSFVSSITFNNTDWFTPKTVTVTGVNDDIDDDTISYSIATTVTSLDAKYNAVNPADVAVNNLDNDTAGVNVTPTSGLATTEAGGTATFTVVLVTEPVQDVTINFSSTAEATVTPTVTFNATNWFTPATITVTGVNDDVDDDDQPFTITTTMVSTDPKYSAIDPADVTGTNQDNDTRGVIYNPTGALTTSEPSTGTTFTVRLATKPILPVTVNFSSSDTTEGTVTASATFDTNDWDTPKTITVSAVNDDVDDGSIAYTLQTSITSTDGKYNGFDPADISVTNNDDDSAGITVSAISGATTESNGTATFTVVLTSEPTQDVTVSAASSDLTEGDVTLPVSKTLTFTPANWFTAQTFTVTGADDLLLDGTIAYTINVTASSADPIYNAIDPNDVAVSNTDNDVPGVTVSAISGNTTEAGGTATFTVVLTRIPDSDVTIAVASNDATEGTVTSPAGGVLTFTPANALVAQTVTVTGVDDLVDDDDQAYTIIVSPATGDAEYAGTDGNDVSVTNTDNDTAGYILAPLTQLTTTEAGGTAQFSFALTSQPVQDVTINVASDNANEGTVGAGVTFTSADWSAPKSITITGVDDFVDDGDIAYSIVTTVATTDAKYAALNPPDVSAINTDDDTAGITVTQPTTAQTTEAGGTAQFSIVLQSRPTANVTFNFTSDDLTEAGSPASITFLPAEWNTPKTVTVTGLDDTLDDGDIAYSIVTAAASSTDPNYNNRAVDDVPLTNIDNDDTGIAVTAISGNTTESGGTATFTVRLTSTPAADVQIAVGTSDATEGTPNTALLTFTPANALNAQTVTVTGQNDDVDDGNIAYTITLGASTSTDGTYAGIDPADIALTNVDDDTVGVTVAQSGANTAVTEGGATDTYTIVLESEPTADVTITVAPGTQLSVNPPALTFTAANWDVPQTVTVTAVDDLAVEAAHNGTLTHTAASTDGLYDGIAVAGITAAITDNDAIPVANAGTLAATEDQVANGTLTATDIDTATLTYSIVANATLGTVAITNPTTGAYTYTPTANANGTDAFTFRVNDGQNNSNTATITVTIAPVNDAPTVTSLGATPNPARLGETVQFTSAGADIDADTLAFAWTYGDGSSGSGASSTHVYTATGVYTATVTITDGKGGSVSDSVSITVQTVDGGTDTDNDADGIPNTEDTDDDNDGFSDAFEAATGGNPLNGSDAPGGGVVLPLTIAKMSIALNFTKPATDSVSISGTIAVPAGYTPAGKAVTFDVGGAIKTFTLDAKGKSKIGSSTLAISIKAKKGVVAAQTSKFTLKYAKETLAPAFADEGLTNVTASNAAKTVRVNVLFNGSLLRKDQPQTYSAKSGKGKTK